MTSFLFWKPYGVMSQFRPSPPHQTLADFGPFPSDVHPVGRLDADSEGLLLLTSDGRLQHRLLNPRFAHPRTYLAQVERIPDEAALQSLRDGIVLDGRPTRPAEAKLFEGAPDLPPRPVPIRFRKSVPTAWIELTLREGRNRQVRRMTAAVGHPTLRLVRVRIGSLTLAGLEPGQCRPISEAQIQAGLR